MGKVFYGITQSMLQKYGSHLHQKLVLMPKKPVTFHYVGHSLSAEEGFVDVQAACRIDMLRRSGFKLQRHEIGRALSGWLKVLRALDSDDVLILQVDDHHAFALYSLIRFVRPSVTVIWDLSFGFPQNSERLGLKSSCLGVRHFGLSVLADLILTPFRNTDFPRCNNMPHEKRVALPVWLPQNIPSAPHLQKPKFPFLTPNTILVLLWVPKHPHPIIKEYVKKATKALSGRHDVLLLVATDGEWSIIPYADNLCIVDGTPDAIADSMVGLADYVLDLPETPKHPHHVIPKIIYRTMLSDKGVIITPRSGYRQLFHTAAQRIIVSAPERISRHVRKPGPRIDLPAYTVPKTNRVLFHELIDRRQP